MRPVSRTGWPSGRRCAARLHSGANESLALGDGVGGAGGCRIAIAPGSGLIVAQTSDEAMIGMTRLPLYVIAAVFVPTMILTNVLIMVRLLRDRPRALHRSELGFR